MNSDPAPENIGNHVCFVSSPGWRKLKRLRVRIRPRDGDQFEVSVILANSLEVANFIFNKSDRFVVSGKTADGFACRRSCRRRRIGPTRPPTSKTVGDVE